MKTKKSVTSYSAKLVLLCVFSLISYIPLQAQDSVKIGWFSFNIYSALVINKSFRSLYDSELYSKPLAAMSYYNSIEYTSIKNDPVCFGYSGGIEGVFGRKKFKQLLGFYFDITNSHYSEKRFESYRPHFYYRSTEYNLDVKRQVQTIGANYGVLINCNKHLDFSLVGCFNQILKKTDQKTGTQTNNTNGIIETSAVNYKEILFHDTNFVSLRARLGYNLEVKHQKFSIFVLHNVSIPVYHNNTFDAPWWMLGLQFSPMFNTKIKKVNYEIK